MSSSQPLNIGSRTSNLAMWQTRHIVELLHHVWPGIDCRVEPFVTKGDKTLDQPLPQIGGKGLFTLELENALRARHIDLAIHSLKDLPVENASELTLGAIVGRADVRDVLVSADGCTLDALPNNAVIGTSSLRRQAQLLRIRPDLDVRSIRGNVETRMRKVTEGQYDATVLAAAGITRLGLEAQISEYLALDTMLPAPGQGALAVQCRSDDTSTLDLLAAIHQPDVATAVIAERSFLHHLDGGCSTPVAALAIATDDELTLTGLVLAPQGEQVISVNGQGTDGWTLGAQLAEEALSRGAWRFCPVVDGEAVARGHRVPRVVITRRAEQASALATKLRKAGLTPITFPTIRLVALPTDELDTALAALSTFDWLVFTSVNAVDFFFRRVDELSETSEQVWNRLQSTNWPLIAVVGKVTARALVARGLQPDFMPNIFTGAALAAELDNPAGRRILLPRAKAGGQAIVDGLSTRGATVLDIPLYDTVTAAPTSTILAELAQGFEAIAFASPSSVHGLLEIAEKQEQRLKQWIDDAVIACIGPVTAETARRHGLMVALTPDEYTLDALVQSLVAYFDAAVQTNNETRDGRW